MEQEPIHIEERWKEEGASFVLAHPDDEALMWGFLTGLRAAEVPVDILYLTGGELGIPERLTRTTPEEMKSIRNSEAREALSHLGVSHTILGLGDLHVSLNPGTAVEAVLAAVRQRNPGLLVSFHDLERTRQFDHPDHTTAGYVTRFAGASADVTHFFPKLPAMHSRPSLLLWTTNPTLATHIVPLPPEVRDARNEYLARYHESQFERQAMPQWGEIFDRITYQKGRNDHAELYTEVR